MGQRKARPPGGGQYEQRKAREAERQAELSRAGRDIGKIPKVAKPRRRARAVRELRAFAETYFPETFSLAWSPDHLTVIGKMEQAVTAGGLFAVAMPRGSGKTSLAETGCIWAILCGHRDFVALIGSSEGHALQMLESIKAEFETNDLLLADFPEAVYPVRCLEGITHRARGQLHQGERTRMVWTATEVVLPAIAGSQAAGAIIKVAGITGQLRGMKHKRADGRSVRPSLVVIDDPQTDESAKSPSQVAQREAILAGAVLGLAGPGRKISGIMPCTVIQPGDMADRILDQDKHPEWQGERSQMVYSFPTNKGLWDQYEDIRTKSLREGKGLKLATTFYRRHRKAMDEGARVAWPQRFNEDEASAIQHAMNLKIQDESAFWAEYQNDPRADDEVDDINLVADQVMAKANGIKRGEIPLDCSYVTAFIDVQQKALFFTVCAWEDNFTGYVVDYGTYPDQGKAFFTLREARISLAMKAPGAGFEGSIYAGLENLTDQILGVEWRRRDGTKMKVDRCVIDANWGKSTDVVYQFCRQSKYSALLIPSHGKFVGASSRPFSEYRRNRGDRVGLNWRIPSVAKKRSIRHLVYDTNYWKSFIYSRLAVHMGDPGCLSLFGAAKTHRLFAEHLVAEYQVKTAGRGRTVEEWKIRPERFDNHWFDCLVGCAVAASLVGVALAGVHPEKKAKKAPLKLSEIQRNRRLRR